MWSFHGLKNPGMRLFVIVPSVPWQCVWSMAARSTRPLGNHPPPFFFGFPVAGAEPSFLQDHKWYLKWIKDPGGTFWKLSNVQSSPKVVRKLSLKDMTLIPMDYSEQQSIMPTSWPSQLPQINNKKTFKKVVILVNESSFVPWNSPNLFKKV